MHTSRQCVHIVTNNYVSHIKLRGTSSLSIQVPNSNATIVKKDFSLPWPKHTMRDRFIRQLTYSQRTLGQYSWSWSDERNILWRFRIVFRSGNCDSTFVNQKNLNAHMSARHGNKTDVHECKEYQSRFSNKRTLVEDVKRKHGKNQSTYAFPVRGKIFHQKKILMKHKL